MTKHIDDKGKTIKIDLAPVPWDRILSFSNDKLRYSNQSIQMQKYQTGNASSMIESNPFTPAKEDPI